MKYDDFKIHISAKGDGVYEVDVESKAGEANAEFKLRYTAEELVARLEELSATVRGVGHTGGDPGAVKRDMSIAPSPAGSTEAPPIDVGKELFEYLFSPEVTSRFDSALTRAELKKRGLRIKLMYDPKDPEVAYVAGLPWELMYREASKLYLNTSRKTPLVRYLNVPLPNEPLPFEGTLRVLVVVSSPEGVPPLNLEHEKEVIQQSWGAQPGVEVDFLEKATTQELQTKLAEKEYHVVHYMGHGDFDPETGTGVLLMEDDAEQADPVTGEILGMLLGDASSLRLVFLNACNTAKLSKEKGQDPFAGVATALVMAGVPAVVAMQFPITDGAAIEFAKTFYPRLVQAFPVDAAVAEARKAIRAADADSLEWATPVLFMCSPDGVLFERGRRSSRTSRVTGSEPRRTTIQEIVLRLPTKLKLSKRNLLIAGIPIAALLAFLFLPKLLAPTPKVGRMLLSLSPEHPGPFVAMGENAPLKIDLFDDENEQISEAKFLEKYDIEWTGDTQLVQVGEPTIERGGMKVLASALYPGNVSISAKLGDVTSQNVGLTIAMSDKKKLEVIGAHRSAENLWNDPNASDSTVTAAYKSLRDSLGWAFEWVDDISADVVDSRIAKLDSAMALYASAQEHDEDTIPILERKDAWENFMQDARNGPERTAAHARVAEVLTTLTTQAWVDSLKTCTGPHTNWACAESNQFSQGSQMWVVVTYHTPVRDGLTVKLLRNGDEVTPSRQANAESARGPSRHTFFTFTLESAGTYEVQAFSPIRPEVLLWKETVTVQ